MHLPLKDPSSLAHLIMHGSGGPLGEMGCSAARDLKAFECVQLYGTASSINCAGIMMTEDELSKSREFARYMTLRGTDVSEISYVCMDAQYDKWIYGPMGDLGGRKSPVSDLVLDAYRPNHSMVDGHRCASLCVCTARIWCSVWCMRVFDLFIKLFMVRFQVGPQGMADQCAPCQLL